MLTYSGFYINILYGNIILHRPYLKVKNNEEPLQNHSNLKLETLKLNGMTYLDLFFNETLSIKNIFLKRPQLHYYTYKNKASKKLETKTYKKLI